MTATMVKIPELPELTFEEKGHIYRLDGMQIPSVSKLMEPLKVFCYAGVSSRTLANAAKKGTSVHNSIENWLKFGIEDIPAELRGYYEGFREWWDEYNPVMIASEMKIYNKLVWYGGTIDLLCLLGDELALVDFKTTYNLEKKVFGVQLEAYSQALKSHGIQIQRKHILHMKKDGKWAFPEFPVKDLDGLEAFEHLKKLYTYMQ